MKKTVVMLVLVILLGGAVSACNTMEGLGQDIKKAGSSLEGAASKNK